MQEDVVFRRRNRLKKHFVNTSNVLLYSYQSLSDAAKITYQVIDGFDWESTDTGDSKGYVFPAVATLAQIRHTSPRTIQRHIKDLEQVRLLTRQRRRYKASILFIEDVAENEATKYLEQFVDKSPNKHELDEAHKSRNDKNVVSQRMPETTKMSFVYMKENEVLKEDEIIVNEDTSKKRGGMSRIGEITMRFDTQQQRETINTGRRHKLKPEQFARRDYYALEIARELQDQKSLGCYRVIADKVPQTVVFEALASVKDVAKDGKIRKSKGALFIDIIKTYCEKNGITLGFKQAADPQITKQDIQASRSRLTKSQPKDGIRPGIQVGIRSRET